MGRPGYLMMPIFVVLVAIGYTTVFVAVDVWLGLATDAGVTNAAAFATLMAAFLATYVAQHPGTWAGCVLPTSPMSRTPRSLSTRSSGRCVPGAPPPLCVPLVLPPGQTAQPCVTH